IQHSFTYSDGFGREIQHKALAEPGPLPLRDTEGHIVMIDSVPQMGSPPLSSARWIGSGWQVFNNKGKPVRQYEPFFTDTPQFELAFEVGVSPTLFYDPLQRVVAVLNPDHTFTKSILDPWRQESWDVNDTVLITDPQNDANIGAYF